MGMVGMHAGIIANEDVFPFDRSMRCDCLAFSQKVTYRASDAGDLLPP